MTVCHQLTIYWSRQALRRSFTFQMSRSKLICILTIEIVKEGFKISLVIWDRLFRYLKTRTMISRARFTNKTLICIVFKLVKPLFLRCIRCLTNRINQLMRRRNHKEYMVNSKLSLIYRKSLPISKRYVKPRIQLRGVRCWEWTPRRRLLWWILITYQLRATSNLGIRRYTWIDHSKRKIKT